MKLSNGLPQKSQGFPTIPFVSRSLCHLHGPIIILRRIKQNLPANANPSSSSLPLSLIINHKGSEGILREFSRRNIRKKMGEAQSKSAKARRETSKRAPLTDLSNTSPSSSPPPSRLKGKQKENMAEAEPTPIEARRETSERAALTDLSNTSPSPSLPSSPHLKEKQKENMAEAESTPIEARRKINERAPLADLSNKSPSSLFSSHSSSPSFTDSLSKYSFSWARKPSLAKNLIPNDSSNTNSKLTFVESNSNNDDNNQKQKDKGKQKKKGKSQGNKENPGSARSPFPKTSSVSGNFHGFLNIFLGFS